MIEKIEAYKLSDGELVESREQALRCQRHLDIENYVRGWIQKNLSPEPVSAFRDFPSTPVVTLWKISQVFRYNYDLLKAIAPKPVKQQPVFLLEE